MGIPQLKRRRFLQLAVIGSTGLMLGARLTGAESDSGGTGTALHPLIHIDPEHGITLFAQNPDLGQGVKTSLPMILAEELDVRWENISVRQADWIAGLDEQFSGGSLSMRINFEAMRQAGAAARHMLLQAAAQRWAVPIADLQTGQGRVIHAATGKSFDYRDLAADAAGQPVPEALPRKSFKNFGIVGKPQHDVDGHAIVTGQPLYSLDQKLPGMLFAVFRRSPLSDGQVESFTAEAALKIPGVHSVHALSNEHYGGRIIRPNSPNFVSGVAVLADSTWAAMQGARAVRVEWRNPADSDNLASPYAAFTAALGETAAEVRADGDAPAVIAANKDVFSAEYRLPLLSHAQMEPMNCTARFTDDRLELWAPTQNPGGLAEVVAAALAIDTTAISIHVLRSGGAFGRRYYSDFAIDTALLARKTGRPVKVVWSREEDMQHGYYRPAGVHRITAATGGQGQVTAWHHRLAGHSRTVYLEREDPAWDSEIDGYTFPAGFIPNLLLEHVHVPSRVPVGQWRAISESANVFVVGSAIDELAHRAGIDPVEYWLQLIGVGEERQITENAALNIARLRDVIGLVAERSGWGRALPAGRGRGFAASYNQGSWVAEVAEVTVREGHLGVDRVVAAVDCGLVINPTGARAQVEGGIMDGLSAALMGEITVREGVVEQSNFHDYPLLRMHQAPQIEVHFVASRGAPRGLGEPPLPPLAPAVANAVFAACGQRVRELPFNKQFRV